MPARPWFPFYGGDYLADTAHLTNELHGCYLKLMIHAWNHDGLIPEDRRARAAILGVHTNKLETLWGSLEGFWYRAQGGFRHKRIDKELAQANEKTEKARSSARARWDANASPKHMRSQCSPQPHKDTLDSSPSLLPENPNSEKGGGVLATSPANGASSPAPCPLRKIIDLYHQHCYTLKPVRKAALVETELRVRWREVLAGKDRDNGIGPREPELALQWFENFFVRVQRSDWLAGRALGRDGHPFRHGRLAWLVKRENFYKILEGTYD